MSKEMRQRLERFIRRQGLLFWQRYLVLYKAVTRRYASPFQSERLFYRPYTDVSVAQVNKDPRWSCGEGIHVGTRDCALVHVHAGDADRLMRVLVHLGDIACVSDDAISALRADVLRHKLRVRTLFVVDDILRRKDGKVFLRERPLDDLLDMQ